MTADSSQGRSLDAQKLVDPDRVLDLEQALIRIPSSSFDEGEIADYLAEYMTGIGLEVEMMEVASPRDPAVISRQPIGRLAGTGGGPSLMLNGHMDPGVEMSGWSVDPYGAKFEDGWIWGMGAHDDKGGIAAMVNAVDAVIRSGARLSGDVLVCPVVAHKYGGAGTRALIRGRGHRRHLHQPRALREHHRQRLRGHRHGPRSHHVTRSLLPVQPRGPGRFPGTRWSSRARSCAASDRASPRRARIRG